MKHSVVADEDREVIGHIRCLEPEPVAVVRHRSAHIADGQGRDRLVHAGRGAAVCGLHGHSLVNAIAACKNSTTLRPHGPRIGGGMPWPVQLRLGIPGVGRAPATNRLGVRDRWRALYETLQSVYSRRVTWSAGHLF